MAALAQCSYVTLGSGLSMETLGQSYILVKEQRFGRNNTLSASFQRNELQVYVRHKHLPDFLIPRMFSHMVNCYQGKWFEEKAILDDLSEPLKLVGFSLSSPPFTTHSGGTHFNS